MPTLKSTIGAKDDAGFDAPRLKETLGEVVGLLNIQPHRFSSHPLRWRSNAARTLVMSRVGSSTHPLRPGVHHNGVQYSSVPS
jgi:hypothetical protein